jgi:hypothetical protein
MSSKSVIPAFPFKAFISIVIAIFVVGAGFYALVAYVLVHFISKFW